MIHSTFTNGWALFGVDASGIASLISERTNQCRVLIGQTYPQKEAQIPVTARNSSNILLRNEVTLETSGADSSGPHRSNNGDFSSDDVLRPRNSTSLCGHGSWAYAFASGK
jgi:hypothetical protein